MLKNFQAFLVLWVVIIIANQLFIFGACFAPYCLVAALPHTFVIALLVNFFILMDGSSGSKNKDVEAIRKRLSSLEEYEDFNYTRPNTEIQQSEFDDAETPYCPKCGSVMKLR